MPGERVEFRYQVRRSRFDAGVVAEIQQGSALRVAPLCPHAGICGGCSLQHMQSEAQIEHKQQVLLEQLCHHVGESPAVVFPPLTGPVWGYRRKARIGVKLLNYQEAVRVPQVVAKSGQGLAQEKLAYLYYERLWSGGGFCQSRKMVSLGYQSYNLQRYWVTDLPKKSTMQHKQK